MSDIENITHIQKEKLNEIVQNGVPPLSKEEEAVMSCKRMSLDEPPFFRKQDPLR